MPGNIIEPYPHQVRITSDGVTLAETMNGLLHLHGHAPDIYLPRADLNMSLLRANAADAAVLDADLPGRNVTGIAWWGDENTDLRDHVAFAFDKVTVEVDGAVVRGHVRDPHKVITVSALTGRLRMSFAGRWVVDSTDALELRESGLPARYYVPAGDMDESVLQPSKRQTVCTYKGEATYHHLRDGDQFVENAVWTYAEPWMDFAADIGKIAGYRGLYASAFDRITLDGRQIEASAQDAATDRAMISKPTVDRILREKLRVS